MTRSRLATIPRSLPTTDSGDTAGAVGPPGEGADSPHGFAAAVLPTVRAGSRRTELPQQVATRALAQAAALLTWGWLLTAPVVVVLGFRAYDVESLLAVVGAMALAAAGLTITAVRNQRMLHRVPPIGLAVAAAGMAAIDVLSPDRGLPANPATSLMATACLVAGLVLPRGRAITAAAVLCAWQCWWDLGLPASAPYTRYLEVLLTAAGAVAGARFVARSLVRSSLQVSELVNRMLAERRAAQDRQVRERSLAAARADLHDTVLTTLSGVGAGWLGSSDPATLHAELDRDIRQLSDLAEPEVDGSVDLAHALRAMSAATLFEQLRVLLHAPAPCRVPAVVADAFALAAREALVNVLKHGGVDTVSVTVEHDAGTATVYVRDSGRGFDPDLAATGMGRPGMAARMAEIGGSADVVSTPGAGTTVILRWSESGAGQSVPVPPLWSLEGPRVGAMGLTVIAGVSEILSFGLQAGTYDGIWPHVTALTTIVAVDAVLLAAVARWRRMPGWLSAVLIARIAVVLLLSGHALPGCAAMSYQHFSGGGELITCIVITLLRPRWEALTAAGVYAGCWLLLGGPLFVAGQSCGITAVANIAMVLGLVVAAMTFVGALRRHAAIAAEVLAVQESLAGARNAQRVRAAERRRLLPVVRGIVTDTVTGLADGRLDPADAEVRRLCRRDAQLLRGFLMQVGEGDDLVTELFARAVALRRSGAHLAIRGTLPRGTIRVRERAAVLAALDSCLTTVFRAGWSGEGLITVLRAGDDVLVTVVLRAIPPALAGGPVPTALLGAAARHRILDRAEVTDGDLWLTCRVESTSRQDTPGQPA